MSPKMSSAAGPKTFEKEPLLNWTKAIFQKIGVPTEDASTVADSLIEADLRGVESHGITRLLGVYVKRIQSGVMNHLSKLEIVREKPSVALIDCHNSFGQVGARLAMTMAIEKARHTGIGFVATTHSNHYGTAGYWAMMALKHGMIGFSATNTPAMVAPTGGRQPMLGTNPFAVAIPAGNDVPFVLDLATTVVARGRIALHAKQDKPLDPGWAFDELGQPTTDPHEALRGLLAPLGGHKGYGLALAIDILCGLMTGANYGAHFPGVIANNFDTPTDVGSVFFAINIECFTDLAEFGQRIDKAFSEIRNCAKAAGTQRIYIPGEISFETKRNRLANGIPLPNEIIVEFEGLGRSLGIPFPSQN